MTTDRPPEYLIGLVRELRQLPAETEWVEFKRNKADPQEIGEYISALSNSAALAGKAAAFVVWGVDDATHEVVGTAFSPKNERVRGEELENWLLRQLSPRINFRFFPFDVNSLPVVLLEIARASHHPVQFNGQEFIRVGSYKKRLKEYPEKERELWRIFDQKPFECIVAAEGLTDKDILGLLEYPAYFDLLHLPLPETRNRILQALAADDLILRFPDARWSVTNLGAILLAKRLSDFRTVARKAIRVIIYRGGSRVETLRELVGAKGQRLHPPGFSRNGCRSDGGDLRRSDGDHESR